MKLNNFKILKSLQCNNFKIILYEVPLQIIFNRNIICKDLNGDVIWQVEDIYSHSNQDSPFINIEPYDKEKIIAYNFDGGQYYISIKTGELELKYNMRY